MSRRRRIREAWNVDGASLFAPRLTDEESMKLSLPPSAWLPLGLKLAARVVAIKLGAAPIRKF